MSATPPLPEDLATCQHMIRELLAQLHGTQQECEQLRHRLDQLLRRLYGPRAEHFDPNQPLLYPEMAQPEPIADTPVSPTSPTEPAARRTPHGRRPLPGNLRRVRRVYELTEAQRCCPGCGQRRVVIGSEISEQLDYEPASLFVVEHCRRKYACAHCQEQVVVAPKPAQPIDKGLPGPGLLAHVITSKYADHLPLYRQERILQRHGVTLDRSTLCGWTATSADLLTPLYALMVGRVLQSQVIHSDDTPLPVLDADVNRKTRQGHIWAYLGDRSQPYTVFDFTPNHGKAGPARFLAGFHGYLHVDAYAGYDGLFSDRGPFEVACWAHARRNFYEARTTDAARSADVLARVRQLYEVEDAAEKEVGQLPLLADVTEQGRQADAVRLRWRQERAVPLLAALYQWLEQERRTALPKSPIGQAIQYALTNWQALLRYTTAGFLAIDNNVSERTLRQCVLGRNYAQLLIMRS